MKTAPYTWWQDGDFYLGYLNAYPDYETQGFSLDELQKSLIELYVDIESGSIPYVRHVSELIIA